MSTLTMRSTHAASPSYVPRTFSRPASPSLGQSLTPKLGETERRGSHLKNEVNEKGSEDAKAILKVSPFILYPQCLT